MKKCPECDLNYIKDFEATCSVCNAAKESFISRTHVDNNKNMVENDLLPILRSANPVKLKALTTKAESYQFLHIRLPLLVECKNKSSDSQACKKEITDPTGHVRYYVQPYDIGGKKYHICSQWWNAENNDSKEILKLLKELNRKQ